MDINTFLEIEQTHDLYHQTINETQPWNYFRVKLWNHQLCKNDVTFSSVKSKGILKVCKSIFQNFLYLIKHHNRKRLKAADILFISHERRVKKNDIYECIYTDRLAAYYENSLILEKPYKMSHLHPLQVENIYYIDGLIIKASLIYLIHHLLRTPKYRQIYKQVQQQFLTSIQEISQAYNIPIDQDASLHELTRISIEIHSLKALYQKLLEKVQPRLIVEAVASSRHCMLLNELAKDKNIITVELQHGTMLSAHATYQYHRDCGCIMQFPDYVFVFSEYWKRFVQLPITDECIKITGYPYFEENLHKYVAISKDSKINILFISQGTVGDELSKLAADLCSLLDSTKFHIIYKLHPSEYDGWESRNPWLVQNNIEVAGSLSHNIYEYFAKSDIQVGVYSTAIFEGLGFGLTTYIYHIALADPMSQLCEQGYAAFVNNAQELYEKIDSNAPKQSQHTEFWKMNAFENICQELDLLLDRKDNL